MFSQLRRLLKSLSRTNRTTRRAANRQPRRTMLNVHTLEDRLVPATVAQDVWSGAGAAASVASPNNNWSNPQNWVGGVTPVAGEALVFEAGPKSKIANNDFAAGTTFASITFQGDGYQITGNGVKLQNGVTNSSGFNTVAIPLTLTDAQTFTDSSDTGLVLSGSINNGGYLLTMDAAGNFVFDGGSISGSGGLTVDGGAKFFLDPTTPDTYTGTTTVGLVTMYLDGAQGNAIAGNLSIGNAIGSNESDVLRLAASNQINPSAAISIGWSGLLDLNGYTNSIGSLTMDGGNLTTGTGLLTLDGNVTTLASATSAIIEGNLSLGSGSTPITFTVASGTGTNDLNVVANISGGPGVELIKAGAGRMQLLGNNSYAGQTLISAGTLVAADANALAGSAATTVSTGATLIYQDPNADDSETLATEPLSVNSGTLEINGNSPLLIVPGSIRLTGSATIEVGTGLTLDLTGQVSGSGSLTKTWAGGLDLDVANSYTGGTVVNNGILALDTAGSLGSGSVKVGGTGTLELEDGLTYADSLTLSSMGNSDGAIYSNGNTTWAGPISITGSSNLDVATGGLLTISGPIGGGAANSLTIGDSNDAAANGTVLFTSANTYAGVTAVSVGTLAVANAKALGSPGGTIANGGTTVDVGASLQLMGGVSFDPKESLTLNGLGMNGAGALQNASGNNVWNGAIQLATSSAIGASANTSLTTAGAIGGPTTSNMQIVGNGIVVLAGNDTNYEGYTRVMSGVLSLDNANALGGAPYNGGAGTTVESGATLQLQGGITYTIEPVILNGAGVGGTEGALESLSGANQWAGPVRLNSNTTMTCDAGSTFTDNIQILNEGNLLTVNAIGNVNFGTILSGAGGLTKDGAGTLTFSTAAPNLYTGPTTINDGTLMLAKQSGIQAITGAGVTINAGGTLAGSGIINANVINSGTLAPGGVGAIGTLTINGTYTQTASGVLDEELGSKNSFDQLQVSGAASLNGTLDVGLLNGYFPAVGNAFPILTFGSSSGTFAMVNLPAPSNGVELVVDYNAKNVSIDAQANS